MLWKQKFTNVFFSTWVFFHEYSRFTGQLGKGMLSLSEAATGGVLQKKVSLKILQISLENSSVGVSF